MDEHGAVGADGGDVYGATLVVSVISLLVVHGLARTDGTCGAVGAGETQALLWREVDRAWVLRTLRWIGRTCLFWAVSDFAAHSFGWATLLAATLTAVIVVLLSATFAWVDVLDRRARAVDGNGGVSGPEPDARTDRTTPSDL